MMTPKTKRYRVGDVLRFRNAKPTGTLYVIMFVGPRRFIHIRRLLSPDATTFPLSRADLKHLTRRVSHIKGWCP
jgi:hypothetical protein